MSQSGNIGGQAFTVVNDIPDPQLVNLPQCAVAPVYVKGAMYYDIALNKMRIGGAAGWETVTSV